MRKDLKCFLTFFVIILASCRNDSEIKRLLNSNKPWDLIEGAYKAGQTGEKKYVPLLLHDDGNPGGTTALQFKGFTVYQEKMFALERILHIKPPHNVIPVESEPDSVNIRFYADLWQNMNKRK